jgi:AcrR family transcriptional regulator
MNYKYTCVYVSGKDKNAGKPTPHDSKACGASRPVDASRPHRRYARKADRCRRAHTRGALYANFNDKEDLFFALLEEWIGERVLELGRLLRSESRSPHEKLETLRTYYAQCARDRRLVLLSLEFTLYAIRHPSAHARLRIRKRRLRAHGTALIREMTRSSGRSTPACTARRPRSVSAKAATAALGALSNALLLEHVVDPETVTEADVRDLLGKFFDAVVTPRRV